MRSPPRSQAPSAIIEQQQEAEKPHTELGDCIQLVAACVWDAALAQGPQ
ncbi:MULTISPECIES: hypothetical protein [Streptomyces]|nr:hypothetical protein [Streptomyces sp. CGMCC 4.1456]WNF67270.1 hypothetical protein RJD14_34005 [Streptomyces sp. CGMCC 4.1456]